MSERRTRQAEALEKWAEKVDPAGQRVADTSALRSIAEIVDQRERVEAELSAAVQTARAAHRSWSEIGTMLGVSKQAAQRKYANKTSA